VSHLFGNVALGVSTVGSFRRASGQQISWMVRNIVISYPKLKLVLIIRWFRLRDLFITASSVTTTQRCPKRDQNLTSGSLQLILAA
jgi:hypothetical protein